MIRLINYIMLHHFDRLHAQLKEGEVSTKEMADFLTLAVKAGPEVMEKYTILFKENPDHIGFLVANVLAKQAAGVNPERLAEIEHLEHILVMREILKGMIRSHPAPD